MLLPSYRNLEMAKCPKVLIKVGWSRSLMSASTLRASSSLASMSFANAAGMIWKATSCFGIPRRSATSPALYSEVSFSGTLLEVIPFTVFLYLKFPLLSGIFEE